jgi:hypothetical protein
MFDPLSSGEITYIGVPIREILVFITQNGGVYSRNAFSQDEQQSEVFNILKTLAGIDAISIKKFYHPNLTQNVPK